MSEEELNRISESRNISPPPRQSFNMNRPPQNSNQDDIQFRHRGYNSGRIKLAKSSGKASAYMIFVIDQGRKRFFREQGRQFHSRDHNDIQIMGSYWMSISDNERAAYKQRENEANKDPALVTKRRHEADRRRREAFHRQPDDAFVQMKEHRQQVQEQQNRARNVLGYTQIAHKDNIRNTLPIFTEEIAAKREQDRDHLKNVITFSLRMNSCSNRNLDKTIQLISVFPIIFIFDSAQKEAFCYPAEIGITTFSFKDGIIGNESIQVHFDPKWFYSGKSYESDKISIEAYSSTLGVPITGPKNGMQLYDAWNWVFTKIDKDAFQLCDVNQYTWVGKCMRLLALKHGQAGLRNYQDFFVKRLQTVQDFARTMVNNISLDIPQDKKWSDAKIEEAFSNNELRTIEERHPLCKFHAKRSIDEECKFQCPSAHNSRLMHVLCEVMNSNGVLGFRQLYNPEIHELCETSDEDFTLPLAPPMDRATFYPTPANESSVQQASQVPGSSRGTGVIPPNQVYGSSRYEVNILSDSDSDEFDEDPNILADNMRNVRGQTGQQQTVLRSGGFPFINYGDSSSAQEHVVHSAYDERHVPAPVNRVETSPGPPIPSSNFRWGMSSNRETRLQIQMARTTLDADDEERPKYLLPINNNRPRPYIEDILNRKDSNARITFYRFNLFDDALNNKRHPTLMP